MAFSSCISCYPQLSLSLSLSLSLKVDRLRLNIRSQCILGTNHRFASAFKSNSTELSRLQFMSVGNKLQGDWSFIGGSRLNVGPKLTRPILPRKGSAIQASWLTNSQIASGVFTLGTVAVLPFYTLMVVAPKAELTKKTMESSMPYIGLGLLYAYLLCLSWTPDTLRLMFASKYWLPELPGIANMFSNEMTLASAWIHLLGVDLFAARQVFHDGLENKIETRHSVSLCLLFCPIGIVTHFITKALTKSNASTRHGM